jgi:hypothetical protein
MKLSIKENSTNYVCTVVEIKDLFPIEGADKIQRCVVNGNDVVVSKDVKLGDILENDSKVEGTMKLNNLDSNNERIQNFHKVHGGVNNNFVYVTGEHLIYNQNLMDFQHVKDYPNVTETEESSDYFICLITTNHIIKIGGLIFHDWEDNNGSPSKDV